MRFVLGVVVGGLALVAGAVHAPASGAAPPATTCGALHYGGSGSPELLVVSDLPLQGSSRRQTKQMADAIALVFEQHAWMAGSHTVGYYSCDDATASRGRWDPHRCSSNAAAYAAASELVGVIGPFNSGCSAREMPVLNTAAGGMVTMISPSNTYPCITRHTATCARTDPARYFPSGKRNYTRLVGNDIAQGAALALFARQHGLRRVFVLDDGEAYGIGIARYFRNAARRAGIRIVGVGRWGLRSSTYPALMRRIKSTRPGAILLGGLVDSNGAALLRAKLSVLGPNSGSVKVLASDGFATQWTIDEAPAAARGMWVSVPGVPPDKQPLRGRQFLSALYARVHTPIEPYTIYGAQAAELLLSAIASSDATRIGVRDAVFGAHVTGGLVADFHFDSRGDPSNVPSTFYKAGRFFSAVAIVRPSARLVNAAAG